MWCWKRNHNHNDRPNPTPRPIPSPLTIALTLPLNRIVSITYYLILVHPSIHPSVRSSVRRPNHNHRWPHDIVLFLDMIQIWLDFLWFNLISYDPVSSNRFWSNPDLIIFMISAVCDRPSTLPLPLPLQPFLFIHDSTVAIQSIMHIRPHNWNVSNKSNQLQINPAKRIAPALEYLRWLNAEQRIRFKISSLLLIVPYINPNQPTSVN